MVSVTRRDLERHFLTPAAHHQLGVGVLNGFRHQRGVIELIVAASKSGPLPRPQRFHHLTSFVEAREPLTDRAKRNPVGSVFVLLPPRPDAAD